MTQSVKNMVHRWTSLGFFIFFSLSRFSVGMVVLSTGRMVAQHRPGSGAELLHSTLATQPAVTICARIMTYQFTHQDYPEPMQTLLGINSERLLGAYTMTEEKPAWKRYLTPYGSWQNGKINLVDDFRTQLNMEDNWRPGEWNSVCILLDTPNRTYQTWFNGRSVSHRNDYSGYHSGNLTEGNVRIMGRYKDNVYSESLFGAMTDINIWNQILSQTEVELWSRCELGAGGNLLDWSTAQWRVVRLEELEMERSAICGGLVRREELVLLSRARLTFHQITAYCSKLGGEMTRLRDAATVARLRPRLQLVASICGDSFYRSNRI